VKLAKQFTNQDIAELEAAPSDFRDELRKIRGLQLLIVEVNEFIKTFKIPQKVIASKVGMNYTTFRKKVNEAGNSFNEEEAEAVRKAIIEYVEEMNRNVQKFL